LITTEGKAERAVLVGLILDGQSDEEVTEYLDELEFLAKTAGIETVKSFTQRMVHPDTRSFVGKGKLFEINTYIKENNIDVIIFDDDLTPSQLRNIEKEVKKKVYDRSLLILDIFQFRAQTAQSKTQVELARLQYLLPRLTNMWTHLERQRGGTGTRGGAGEKEIETDRRRIRKKISLLEDKLRIIDKQNEVQRKNRQKMVRVALVGYTNVGKSTLMTLLSKSEVFAENKLFATLDTTVRKVVVENLPFLLSDTVGFIRKLPHQLVESFKSTLDEARESDILIHIVDISHANFEDHIQVVNKTLSDIGAADKPTILLFNKIDNYRNLDEGEFDFTANAKQNVSLIDLKKTWMANEHTECIFISAQNKININELKEQLYHMVRSVYETKYPYNHYLY
jgi:GTP-binding protein HflX|tara:strand:+ start:7365 stop:8552 length:1188 start_codon:yes stop_codon:yes gene_type:complete